MTVTEIVAVVAFIAGALVMYAVFQLVMPRIRREYLDDYLEAVAADVDRQRLTALDLHQQRIYQRRRAGHRGGT